MHSNFNPSDRERQSVSTKILDPQPLYIVGERPPLPSGEWMPRGELRCCSSWIIRDLIVKLKLLLAAKLAARWGDTADCNLVLDALLVHKEAGNQ
jgi:hypothetical protein